MDHKDRDVRGRQEMTGDPPYPAYAKERGIVEVDDDWRPWRADSENK
jgi:hypothetical protein